MLNITIQNYHHIQPILYNQLIYGLTIQYFFIYFLRDETIVVILNNIALLQSITDNPFIHTPLTHFLVNKTTHSSPFITVVSHLCVYFPLQILETLFYKQIITFSLNLLQIESLLVCLVSSLPFSFSVTFYDEMTMSQLPLVPFQMLSNIYFNILCNINTYIILKTQGFFKAILFHYTICILSVTGMCHIIYLWIFCRELTGQRSIFF